MAFQTNVLADGVWVTRTVDIESFITSQRAVTPQARSETPPECALWSRTVVESPVVHWILPVRLRSTSHNDVVFVGDHFIQVRELKSDRQLYEVYRKNDFGSRIRNARVVGSFFDDTESRPTYSDPSIKTEEDYYEKRDDRDCHALSYSSRPFFPPQILVLGLENGAVVFLFLIEQPDGSYQCATSCVHNSKPELVYPGFHLAIDPSSRYLASACAEGMFVIHELNSLETMAGQCRAGSFSPIAASFVKHVNGVIHKMEFLHPRAEDPESIILLLIIVKNGKSRMVVYDWELGEDLKGVFAEEHNGIRLPPEHEMPLLIVPLTVQTSFFSVSESCIAVFHNVLEGSLNIETVPKGDPPETDIHRGLGPPLWTAWSRPVRRKEYQKTKDNIYLAREDGLVMFLETSSTDLLASGLVLGNFGTNISTAFASVVDIFSDVFIIGGDCGNGTVWALDARQNPEHVGTIPNWSPALDFVVVDHSPSSSHDRAALGPQYQARRDRGSEMALKSDRVFTTSGRGHGGCVTEYRRGIKAHIGLDIDYGTAIRQLHVFPAKPDEGDSHLLLLTLPDSTDVFELSPDLREAKAIDRGGSPFDYTSRTLSAHSIGDGNICQVTETSIVITGPSSRTRRRIDEILGVPGAACENASGRGEFVAMTTYSRSGSQINIVKLDDLNSPPLVFDVPSEVTSLQFCTIAGRSCILAAAWRLGYTSLLVFFLDGNHENAFDIPIRTEDSVGQDGLPTLEDSPSQPRSEVEAITSLAVFGEFSDKTLITAGTRGGYLVVLEVQWNPTIEARYSIHRLGLLSVGVMASSTRSWPPGTLLVWSDSGLLLLADYDRHGSKGFRTRERIWPTDAKSLDEPSLPIDFACVWPRSPPHQAGHVSIIALSGSRILFMEMVLCPEIVPRQFPIDGTPLRMIYSKFLEVLVIAAQVDGASTLLFLDPETGEDLSWATDKNGDGKAFAAGLGKPGRIHCLYEWPYPKNNKTFLFFLVTTGDGRMLIISAERTTLDPDASGVGREAIRYWTRYKKKGFSEPVYSVYATGENVFYCAGSVIHWEVLDLAQRRLIPKATFMLESPATSLDARGERLFALMANHSLAVLNLCSEKDPEGVGEGPRDGQTRQTLHMIIGGCVRPDFMTDEEALSLSPVVLVSDKYCGVVGLWAPAGANPHQDLAVVLEAELPASIRRFGRGFTRPRWWLGARGQGGKFGRVAENEGQDMFGVCLDGTLVQFALLDMKAWRVLKLIQNLAERDEKISPFGNSAQLNTHGASIEPNDEPRSQRHINGDIMSRCFHGRALGRLFGDPGHMKLLKTFLREVDGGRWAEGMGEEDEDEEDGHYFTFAYDMLEYLLLPAL